MNHDINTSVDTSIEKELGADLQKIIYEILYHNIVYEGQFNRLYSMFCKKHASDLCTLLTEEMGFPIEYTYDTRNVSFVFYNSNVYSPDKAVELSIVYHSQQMSISNQ